ncbi:V-type ATP synthase subunit I [Thermochromatium tepidum]|uniref:ATPase n=1 Tax=Thermochromatium tepidum ATCC 43061 TaxID=316276 RepID=A0A6I6DY48_THETI|nr:V-type ATPase 116kDa subunit family protein [Thermochromatium tepidum]QGU32494.1 ATPase [Thermochromatium tepidum ATCC 43061]
MLKPTPMKHVRLLVLTEDLPRASLALAETQCFHPDPREPESERFATLPVRPFHDLHTQAQSRLDKIARLIRFEPPTSLEPMRVIEQDELARLNDWLGRLWEEVSNYEEDFRRLDDAERLIREQQAALENFRHLNIDLGMLRTRTRFLNIHVGLVPRENLRQLEGAVALAGHILHVYLEGHDTVHLVIVGPSDDHESDLSPVLAAAGFQRLPIPEELDSEPAKLQRQFARRLDAIAEERATLTETLERWSEPYREPLREAQRTLRLAEPLVQLDSALRSTGHLAHLAGWVPARALDALRRRLDAALAGRYALSVRDPLPEERPLVPTVPVKGRLLAPFALLVNQYGIPSYGEVDPTPLFALTFLIMFGSMFGDVGQGAVIALAAWTLRGRLGRFWPFGLMAGGSSVLFGFLYGSLFGYEHVLPALWMNPLSDPLLMLRLALIWGVFFIVLACLLAIYNRWATGQWRESLFGHHGVVNLVFYLALIAGGTGLVDGTGFGIWPASLVAGSLLVLAWHSWLHQQAPVGEKILVVVIETLETLIGYVSNTLSFLRVAAFSLNHVALSIAVFTLADMMGAFGHVVTVILGNVFVLVLEGGIVMIQVMRLQYYEGFSRYFSGDGYAFRPIRFGRGPA